MISFAASALALILVLVLAFYVIKAGAKLSAIKQKGSGINVLETAAIGPKERIVVVSYNRQRYLLGVTANSVSIVDRLPAASFSVLDETIDERNALVGAPK